MAENPSRRQEILTLVENLKKLTSQLEENRETREQLLILVRKLREEKQALEQRSAKLAGDLDSLEKRQQDLLKRNKKFAKRYANLSQLYRDDMYAFRVIIQRALRDVTDQSENIRVALTMLPRDYAPLVEYLLEFITSMRQAVARGEEALRKMRERQQTDMRTLTS